MIRLNLLFGLVLFGLLLPSGCAMRTHPGNTDPTTGQTGDAEVQSKIAELDHKISTLEKRLTGSGAGTTNGTGAYAHGTTLRVESDGRESLLEKMRRLERELAAANATASAKDRTIADLNHQRDEALATGREAGERADYLTHTSTSLVAAQQTLAERQERIEALTAQLATAELQRLRAERRWYLLASDILRLSPDDARDLPGIQSRIRQATREVRDKPEESAAKP